MRKLCLIVMFVCLSVSTIVEASGPHKLLLTVYYESKCPDSKAFVLEQLVPAMEMLGKYVSLQLVPFGKARSINQGLSGFECQHGKSECLGNLIQDCVLHQMKGNTDLEKLKYVACEMETHPSTEGYLHCVPKAKVSYELIQECVSSEDGMMLQLNSEYLTNRVKPSFIPTVTINKSFNQQIQDRAQEDLVGVLCSMLKEARPCAELYNNQALDYVLL